MVNEEIVNAGIKFHPVDEDITIRTVNLGLQPLVIIEPVVDENDELTFNIDASCMNDQEELADILTLVASVVSNGE